MRWGEIVAWLSKNHRFNSNAAQTKPPPSVAVYERGRECALVSAPSAPKGGEACHSPRLPWNDCKIHGMKMMISTYIIHSIHRIRHTVAIFCELPQSALNYITWHNNHMARMNLILGPSSNHWILNNPASSTKRNWNTPPKFSELMPETDSCRVPIYWLSSFLPMPLCLRATSSWDKEYMSWQRTAAPLIHPEPQQSQGPGSTMHLKIIHPVNPQKPTILGLEVNI